MFFLTLSTNRPPVESFVGTVEVDVPNGTRWEFCVPNAVGHVMAGEISEKRAGNDGGRKPPYVGFSTFVSRISYFKKSGCPEVLAPAVAGGQFITALRFLGLVDGSSRPTPALKQLVASHATANWPIELAQMLRRAYAPLFERDLGNITSSDFNASFRQAFPTGDHVTRKCIAFFKHAAREAEIDVNAALIVNTKPRHSSAMPRQAQGETPRARDGARRIDWDAQSRLHAFVELFNRAALRPVEQAAFDTLLAYLQNKAKVRGTK